MEISDAMIFSVQTLDSTEALQVHSVTEVATDDLGSAFPPSDPCRSPLSRARTKRLNYTQALHSLHGFSLLVGTLVRTHSFVNNFTHLPPCHSLHLFLSFRVSYQEPNALLLLNSDNRPSC